MIRTNNLSRALSVNFFILKLVFVSALIGGITWLFAGYKGLSWTAVVLLIVILFYNFIMSQTVLGRHIYAVGGNPEAAELSGISVKKITYVVFCFDGHACRFVGHHVCVSLAVCHNDGWTTCLNWMQSRQLLSVVYQRPVA